MRVDRIAIVIGLSAISLGQVAWAGSGSCFPESENLETVGRAFVYELRDGGERRRYRTRAVVAKSAAGGVVVCEFSGRPGPVAGAARRRWETDAAGRRVEDSGGGVITKVEGIPECDRGLGACQRVLKSRIGDLVEQVHRRCKGEVYVDEAIRSREGAFAGARITIAQRFDKDGQLVEEVRDTGGRSERLELISTSPWRGADCGKSQSDERPR